MAQVYIYTIWKFERSLGDVHIEPFLVSNEMSPTFVSFLTVYLFTVYIPWQPHLDRHVFQKLDFLIYFMIFFS